MVACSQVTQAVLMRPLGQVQARTAPPEVDSSLSHRPLCLSKPQLYADGMGNPIAMGVHRVFMCFIAATTIAAAARGMMARLCFNYQLDAAAACHHAAACG